MKSVFTFSVHLKKLYQCERSFSLFTCVGLGLGQLVLRCIQIFTLINIILVCVKKLIGPLCYLVSLLSLYWTESLQMGQQQAWVIIVRLKGQGHRQNRNHIYDSC
jgi:hypothetical protein